ncbi:uncharacterized protein LOC110719286 [Chenopodium quinoa]|uniref:uncharacterized protein LOC110719286 n=1 Tax=Chenopodium quinoa TaxID=63459 RepID=UPI000B7784EA|nr:uncharacterized protein LOC110719286 [Chenopodium quinoa]
MAFSPSFTCKNTPYKSLTTSLTYVSSQARRRNQHTPIAKVIIPNPIIFGTANVRKCISHKKKPEIKCKSAEKPDFINLEINLGSVSDVIDIFQVCINNKNNTEQLERLMSENCCIENSSDFAHFSLPDKRQGKKEVMTLLTRLAKAIDSQNLQFKFQVDTCEEKLEAFLNWNLVEMKSQDTRYEGFSKVQCLKEGDTLVIRKLENKKYSKTKK